MTLHPRASFPVLGLFAVLFGQSCSSTSTNDGGPSGSGGDAASGGGGGGAGGACCTASEVPECGCGCPSLFASGALNGEPEVNAFGFDCSDNASFAMDEGCGALVLTGGVSQHCARNEPVSPVDAGGKCVFGRIRIKSSNGGSVSLGVDGTSFQAILSKNPPATWATYSNSCRLPTPYTLDHAFLNVNEGSGEVSASVSLDFVEIFVAGCGGNELPCQ